MRGFRLVIAAAVAVTMVPAAVANGWISAKRLDQIAYFLYDNPPSVARYDLDQRTWLDPIALPAAPMAFEPASTGLYVAIGGAVTRRDLDGSNEATLYTAPDAVALLASDGGILFVYSGTRRVAAVDASTGEELDSRDFNNVMDDIVVAPGMRRLFAYRSGGSNRGLEYADYAADGTLSAPVAWPHAGELRSGAPLFLTEDESLLIDWSGSSYSTTTLAFVNSFGGIHTGIDEIPDGFVVKRNQLLFTFGPDYLADGFMLLPGVAHALFVHGGDAFAFSRGDGAPSDVSVAIVSLDAIPPLDIEAVDDEDFIVPSFLRDGATDENGVSFLSYGARGDIFRLFDTHRQRFIANLRLPIGAYIMQMDTDARRIYGATQEGAFFYFDMDDPARVVPLFNLPFSVGNFIRIDDFIFANTLVGFSSPAFRTYDLEGNALDGGLNGNLVSQYHEWDPNRRRVYHLREHFTPADLLYTEVSEDGVIGATVAAGADSVGAVFPIRVSPDGARILLGSGRIHEAGALAVVGNLPNPIADAAWLNGVLFTLADLDGAAHVQRWAGEDFDPDGALELGGTPLGMSHNGENLVVATQDDEGHRFTVVSPQLAVVLPPNPADVNGDGVVNALDVQLVINRALGLEIAYDADINGDGAVNAVDVQLVINGALGLEI